MSQLCWQYGPNVALLPLGPRYFPPADKDEEELRRRIPLNSTKPNPLPKLHEDELRTRIPKANSEDESPEAEFFCPEAKVSPDEVQRRIFEDEASAGSAGQKGNAV